MKNVLVLTDFSLEADHATDYAYRLATAIKADLILCNAIRAPAEMPMAGFVSWPMEGEKELEKESDRKLQKLRSRLDKLNQKQSHPPVIHLINQSGALKDVAENVLFDNAINLTIMGVHSPWDLSELMLENHARYMINRFCASILLVPVTAIIRPITKIVFAIDFHLGQLNKEFIHDLVPLARSLGAEICISNIYTNEQAYLAMGEQIAQFMFEICSEVGSPRITYRSIESTGLRHGLEILMLDDQTDILVMAHQHHSRLSRLLLGSLTQKIASHVNYPLLVLKTTENLSTKK